MVCRLRQANMLLALLLLTASVKATTVSPPHWWTSMSAPELELMLSGDDVADADVLVDAPGIDVINVTRLKSDNYLFVTLNLAKSVPGTFTLTLRRKGADDEVIPYTLHRRQPGSAEREGFGPDDAIYLVTPDRFANGNEDNDAVKGYADAPDRQNKGGRHGGDLQGLTDHLDYVAQMGFTQIWSMPLLENAMPSYSYHGYAITDYYRIDPRFGTNAQYKALSERASERGIGIIMDVVLNHIGSQHDWLRDPPSDDWIHHQGTFVPTTHRRESLHDPHAVASDMSGFTDGWFVPTMPDLNQRNPHLATYLIQHAIWWIEYAGLSGIRVDTYPYSDKAFLSEWTKRIMNEYPNFTIVGEEWTTNPALTAYWQKGSQRHDNYDSALGSVMDFPLQASLISAVNESESWNSGWNRVYQTLATDFLYGNAGDLVIFADNHDMSRVYTQVEHDLTRWNSAMTFILTTRGIPQVYYGTEILMANPGTDDHGIIRSDFPGGWRGDKVNAFTGKGLTDEQVWAQNRIRQLLSLRKQHAGWFTGEMVHFAPRNGLYVYLRKSNQTQQPPLLVAINHSAKPRELVLPRLSQFYNSVVSLHRLSDKATALTTETLTLAPGAAEVWVPTLSQDN